MAELLIKTAKRLQERFPECVFLIPLASRETRQIFEEAIWHCGASDTPFKLLFGHAQDALAASDAAIVASGTATLEAALMKTPMIIVYRMSRFSWQVMRRMRLQPWVGLPNILAQRFVVPEFLQDEATSENLAQAVGNLVLDKQVRAGIERVFSDLHYQLRQGTAEKAAAVVASFLPSK